MSRGRMIFGAVVVTLGLALAVVVTVVKPETPKIVEARVTNVGQRLRSTGSARVRFTAEIHPQISGPSATWAGVSMVKFGDTDDWDTTYTSIVADNKPAIQGHGVRVGTQTYYTSPSLMPADGRPWFSATTGAYWGNVLADPNLGLPDFTLWQRFLSQMSAAQAFSGSTDDLPDVKGASHEYLIRCTPVSDAWCPPPLGTTMDGVFNQVPEYPRFKAWFDDDGLLRKLEVGITFMYRADGTGGANEAAFHPSGEFFANMTFELDKFGTPVAITAPAADQVTKSSRADRKG